jgi:uncharacterized membrane protein
MTEETVQPIIDGIVQIVFLVTSLISAVQIIYGLIRKIYFTQAGE